MTGKIGSVEKTSKARDQNSFSQIRKTANSQSKNPTFDHILFLQKTAGNFAVQRLLRSGTLQTKLIIGQPGDKYEQEADRVAEQITTTPQMQSFQRKCTGKTTCPIEDDKKEMVQRKTEQPSRTLGKVHENITKNLGKGEPLDNASRKFYEPRFGYDFTQVRLHTDERASESAKDLNARAFTVGKDVAFGAGQYAPGTLDGRRLLAHELTHVIQQNKIPSQVQRKIVVGGKDYAPTPKYIDWLRKNYSEAMVEFISGMHNNGNPPEFKFSSYEQLGYEVRIRNKAIKGIEEAHNSCCNYPDSANPDYLDSNYWNRISQMHFVPKSPFPPGKEASDAIEAIFSPGAGTRLECMSMTVAVEYYSLLKGLGKTKFNQKFPGGVGLEISTRLGIGAHPLFYGPSRRYETKTLANKSEILPGDWLYFKNFSDYLVKHPGGSWQGENAIYLGGGKYRGFGVSSLFEADMNKELVRVYNLGLPSSEQKTVPDLLAQGGGFQLSPVIRPIIGKIITP